ncbi:MAG: hypothetical protein JW720_06515 [Sedimentisphaerales bacterium]|nr:hypothetical protein [Sedimentisphaerales bacterium]
MIMPQLLAGIGIADLESLGIALIVLASLSPLFAALIVYYLKKRLEHRQIMTAIEKGMPLSEIMPSKPAPAGPAWIKYFSTAIVLLFIGLSFLLSGSLFHKNPGHAIAFVLLGVGAGMLARGLLHRKYYLKGQNGEEAGQKSKD